jgi:Phosphotransferase enzyme family
VDEVLLRGGMSTPGVVRVGGTVRRPMNANSEYVHGLLRHLERCGFEGAPRLLGIDLQGREILTYIEGFAPPHNGFRLTETAIRAGAKLVRDVHDLTQGTPFAAGSEVACHRNLSQPNFVFRDMTPIAIIDWDSTRPGTRVENLGDFLWAFVHPAVFGDGEPAARMLRAAVDEYGYEGDDLVEAMLDPVRRWVRHDPDPGEWELRELEYMERNAPLFEASLRTSRA